MATLKLKPGSAAAAPRRNRPPVRGGSPAAPRRTPAQAEADRAARADAARGPAGGRPGGGRAGPPAQRSNDAARAPRSDDAVRPLRSDDAAQPPRSDDVARPPRSNDAARAPRSDGAPRPPRSAPPSPSRPPQRATPGADSRRPPAGPAPSASSGPPPRRAPGRGGSGPRRSPAAPAHDDDHADDTPDHPEIPGSLRLSKRMSQLGLASRREADEWIAKGWVRVDDQVVSQLGSRVVPEQRITIDARAKFQQAQKVTVLLNKPVGWVSGQAEDGHEPAVVLVTPQNQWQGDRSGTRFLREHLKNLVPAGRLDIDSVGLLVLTQDGRIAKQLVGENGDVEKEYLVRVATLDGRPLPADGLRQLRHGIELDGEVLREAQVEWLNDDQLRFVLKEGRKRQIRRMCEAVGLRVLGLKRVRIGRLALGDLPVGQWRYLRADESFA